MDYTNAYELSMKAFEIWHNNPGRSYQEKKADARQLAIEIQAALAEQAISYAELAVIQNNLYILAKQTGLIREFQTNGIL